MPRRRKHREISNVAGVFLGLSQLGDNRPDVCVARFLGAVLGTRVGGDLPDILEPGTSSWHRQSGHSLAAGAGVAWAGVSPDAVAGAVATWGAAATRLRQQQMALPPEDPGRAGLWLQEMGLHVLSAALPGLALGYVLHLLADAESPRGLPLV